MPEPTLDDYRWLVSESAAPFLQDAAADAGSLVGLTQRLRGMLSPVRTHLVLEQVALRERARVKFSHAEQMFFTRQLLEQSTDEQIAEYKARRFPSQRPLADLCCGMGGDLLALVRRGPCLAVDRDPIAVLLAEANCRLLGTSSQRFQVADVRSLVEQLEGAAWHLDPDRRVAAQRTSQVIYSEPGLDVIHQFASRVAAGAVKLASSADASTLARDDIPVELEWIGSRRECRQQVAWLGELASRPGQRTATVISRDGTSHSFTGRPDREVDVAPAASYLFAADPTLIASRLDATLAGDLKLRATSGGATYYTAGHCVDSPLLDVFQVRELHQLDMKRLKRRVRELNLGSLEIKVCGVNVDPVPLRKKLGPKGDEHATLLVFRSAGQVTAAIAERR